MEPSIFTKIINGEIPCHKVYEDEKVFAFLDIHPAAEGHTIVVPKLSKEYEQVWDLPDGDYEKLLMRCRQIAKNLQIVFKTRRVVLKIEGFDVNHSHVHLLPVDNHADMKPQDMSAEPDHEALARVAEKIRAQLAV